MLAFTDRNDSPTAVVRRSWSAVAATICLAMLCGCQPAGPKALLLGEKYIKQGDYERALKHLNNAAELMPAHPQVWNHMGLAWHGSKEPQKAAEAYSRALRIDQKLPAPHFNLGVLLLEQGRLNEAIAALSTFVSLQPTNALGFSKLGAALVQARRPDEAERALSQALRLNPKDAEAHNHLGLVHVQRKRARDAMLAFNEALEDRPNYPAALLNQAIVAQTFFGPDMAIERYQAYLHANKDGRFEEEVNSLIRRLEEVRRPPPEPERRPEPILAQTNEFNIPRATNTVVVDVKPPARTNDVATNRVALRVPPKTSALPATTSLGLQKTSAPPVRVEVTNVMATEPPELKAEEKKEEELPPVVVETVREPDLEIKPPRDIATTSEVQVAVAPRPATSPETPLLIPRRNREAEDRPSILERANPMRWFRSEEKALAPPPSVRATPATPMNSQPLQRVPPQFERYPFRQGVPSAGSRAEAEKLFVRGARAHQAQRLGEALELYRQAVQADPSYFDAQYNLGLAAYQLKQLPIALQANENARLIKPSSVDARYHFAISLREANYPVDAASELRELLAVAPEEERAHFALANLYAQKLDEAALAARHYQRLLEIAPNHPDAAAIRQWLANRP